MKEKVLNISLRKFLKTVGVTSQREIEKAIRTAVADGRLKTPEPIKHTQELPRSLMCRVGTKRFQILGRPEWCVAISDIERFGSIG